jgi:hypothetical protein
LEDAATAKALFELDPKGLSAALAIIEESHDKENDLLATVRSLIDLGEGDAVARALKNVTLGAVMKNTGVKPVQTKDNGTKITTGGNRSPVSFNGSTVKRDPTKAFDTAADRVSKISQTMVDSENINTTAKSILREAIARKADGRLANPTKAASTIDIPANRRPNQEKNAVTKFTDDEESWTTYAKQEAVEATGRMQCSTAAGKTVEIPVVRLASFDDTSSRLPFEFRGVNQSETVPVGFNLGATVDIVNKSSGSAHGAISFNTDGTEPAIKGRTPNYVGPMGKHNFPMSQGQKFLHQVRKDNIEAGPNIG